MEEYDIATGTWSPCPPMSERKTYLTSGVIDGKIYVCGGDYWGYDMPYSNVLEVYDPVSKTWSRKANMPEGLAMPKAVSLNGCLYVVGDIKQSAQITKFHRAFTSIPNQQQLVHSSSRRFQGLITVLLP